MNTTTTIRCLAAAGAVAIALGAGGALGQTKISAMTALPTPLDLAKSFAENFVKAGNARGGGFTIDFLGGPEIQPPRKAASALRRGVIDMLHSPTAYYIGTVPEGYALTLATATPAEIRANGGFAMLEKVWEEKVNAKLLAWGESGTAYHTYLAKEPKFTDDGKLSLSGLKMRVTGTYRPLFTALGAASIGMKASELYTGLQRGVVQGFGWPDVGIVALGLSKLVKFRIQPPFYRSNNTVIINLDVWKKLSQKARDSLLDVAQDYEKRGIAFMEARRKIDEDAIMKAGAKDIVLSGAARKHYIDAANVAVWNRLKKQSQLAGALQQKIFPAWTPPAM